LIRFGRVVSIFLVDRLAHNSLLLFSQVFARFALDDPANSSSVGVFFPEIAPYDSTNSATINTSAGQGAWNSAFVQLSTADAATAADVEAALAAAGAPARALNVEGLASDAVLTSRDWRAGSTCGGYRSR